jgi:hypothetical protein
MFLKRSTKKSILIKGNFSNTSWGGVKSAPGVRITMFSSLDGEGSGRVACAVFGEGGIAGSAMEDVG